MFSKEFFELLTQIIKSWQVIAVTVALVIYINIVSAVARSYRRPRVKKEKVKKPKAEPVVEANPDGIESDSNDELGLEEA